MTRFMYLAVCAVLGIVLASCAEVQKNATLPHIEAPFTITLENGVWLCNWEDTLVNNWNTPQYRVSTMRGHCWYPKDGVHGAFGDTLGAVVPPNGSVTVKKSTPFGCMYDSAQPSFWQEVAMVKSVSQSGGPAEVTTTSKEVAQPVTMDVTTKVKGFKPVTVRLTNGDTKDIKLERE